MHYLVNYQELKVISLNLSSNVVGNSNNETNFSHKLLTNTHVSRLGKANGSSAD